MQENALILGASICVVCISKAFEYFLWDKLVKMGYFLYLILKLVLRIFYKGFGIIGYESTAMLHKIVEYMAYIFTSFDYRKVLRPKPLPVTDFSQKVIKKLYKD